jgi:hypothetical protein
MWYKMIMMMMINERKAKGLCETHLPVSPISIFGHSILNFQ